MDGGEGLTWSKNLFEEAISDEIKNKKLMVCEVILEIAKLCVFQKALGRVGSKPFL